MTRKTMVNYESYHGSLFTFSSAMRRSVHSERGVHFPRQEGKLTTLEEVECRFEDWREIRASTALVPHSIYNLDALWVRIEA